MSSVPTPNDEAPTLLSCPFCGGEAEELWPRTIIGNEAVRCKSCLASVPCKAERAEWNRRAQPSETEPPVLDLMAELKKKLAEPSPSDKSHRKHVGALIENALHHYMEYHRGRCSLDTMSGELEKIKDELCAVSARKPTSHDYFKRDDDLRHCKVCRGGEGSLPTDCPGEQMPESVESAVFAGALDFKDGAWVVRRSDGESQ